MADKSYDAVVIGGGHHATIIAPYLAKAGMKVGVFEKNDRLGGGAVTEDGPTQGFRMAFCAQYTRFYSHPAFLDFNLYDEGLHYVAPETGAGIVTLRPKIMPPLERNEKRKGETVFYSVDEEIMISKTKVLKKIREEISGPKLEEAEIVICGGREVLSESPQDAF